MSQRPRTRTDYYTQAEDAARQIADRADDFALDQLQALRATIDHVLIPATVAVRRNTGATWDEIGKDLGMSKQAAQQRFGTLLSLLDLPLS